jgi:DNA-directed RNA polymerase specialized sigma24 family protein
VQSEPPEIAVPAEVEQLGSTDEIRGAVAALTPERAEALLLHHEWGFTFHEIAGMLGISADTARARSSRGIADLRRALMKTQGRKS